MRTLILMIITCAFLAWFGINYRHSYRKFARISLVISGALAVLILAGFLRLV